MLSMMSTGPCERRQELEAVLDRFGRNQAEAENSLVRLSLSYLRWDAPTLDQDLGDRVLCMLAAALQDSSEGAATRAEPLLRLALRAGFSDRLLSLFMGRIESEELFTVAARIGGESRCYGKLRLSASIPDPHIRQRFESMTVYQGSSGQGQPFKSGSNVLGEVQYYIVPERGPESDPVFDFESFGVGFTYSHPPFNISFSGNRSEEVRDLCRRHHRARWAAGKVPGGEIHPLPDYEVISGEMLGTDGHWDTYEYEVRMKGAVIGCGRYEAKSSGDVPHVLYLGRNGCYFISVILGSEHRLGPSGAMPCYEESVIIHR
jgi:hypothetical protein